MTAKAISESEWVAEIERLRRGADKGHSAAELSEAWGVNINVTRARLRALIAKGRVVVGFRPTTAIDGRVTKQPVYQLKRG